MAQERPLTPEKQLLRLIEDPKTKGSSGVQAQAIKYHSLSLFSFGAWLGRLSFLKDKFREWVVGERSYPDIVKIINAVLGFGVAVLAFYFIASILVSIAGQRKPLPLRLQAADTTKKPQASEDSSRLQSSSYYIDKITQRNIFKMGAKKSLEENAPPSSKILELAQSLKLVGISWSNDPDAMIEDTKATRTFFVKKGQAIGELKVKDITKDKVILTYAGEDIELR
ncbi:MAG: hypothetical protein ACM3IL_01070 [Deltaproteobacteria bacterium]